MKNLLAFILLIPALASADVHRARNVATRVYFGLHSIADGSLLTGATLDCETDGFSDSASGDGFTDLSGAEAEVGSTGVYVVTLTAGEMDFEQVEVKCTSATSNAPDVEFTINTRYGSVATGTSGKLGAEAFSFRGVTTSESTTTIGLASGDVDADDQYTEGSELRLYDSNGLFYGSSCIVDSANSGDTVVLAVDLSSLHTTGDSYEIVPSALCRVFTQITTVPTPATTFDGASLLRVVYQFLVNEWQSTATEATWYRNDGSTVWVTKDISDDDTTATATAAEADD